MTYIKTGLLFTALALPGATSLAAEALLSSDYLQGKWSESGKQGCTSGQAGYVIFHNNRTLEAGRGQTVSAVGFWEPGEDTVTLHLLVSPASGGAGHPFYQKRYHYQYMSPKMLGIQSDSFDYTHDTGVQAGEKRTLTRCQ